MTYGIHSWHIGEFIFRLRELKKQLLYKVFNETERLNEGGDASEGVCVVNFKRKYMSKGGGK